MIARPVAAHDQSKGSQSGDRTRVRRRFPAFIVIDDKGNDVLKDLNLG